MILIKLFTVDIINLLIVHFVHDIIALLNSELLQHLFDFTKRYNCIKSHTAVIIMN